MISIHKSLAIYGMIAHLMPDEPINEDIDPVILEHIRTKRFGSVPGFRIVLRQLEAAMLRCDQCFQGQSSAVEKALKPIADTLKVTRRHRIRGDGGDHTQGAIPDEEVEEEEEEVDMEDKEAEEMDPEDDEEPILPGPTEFLTKPQTIPNVHRASIPAFKLVFPPEAVRMRKFDLRHDNYDTGPTVEDSLMIHRELFHCFDNQPENFKWISVMLRFRDHGYRKLPSSLDQFYLSSPSPFDQMVHFFPTPLPADIAEWKRRISMEPTAEEPLSLDRQAPLPDSCVGGVDMVEWGLREMIDNAGPERGLSSAMAYTTGKTGAGSYIRLNVMKDRVWPKDVNISVDIDSVIWLTSKLKVSAAFNLHTSPYRKEKPPISTANHTYVELLWPRLNEDVAHGRISSGVKQVPLSNLPNTHFATFGRLEGAATVAVVFPRMKHRYPLRNYWETKLPEEVELLWLRDIVYVALHRLESEGIKPYVGFGYEDNKWRHAGAQETTLPLAPEHLEELQTIIDTILQEHTGDPYFDCFLSYFFVLEIRGVKVPTSSDDPRSKDPWDALVKNYPAFDWQYMEDTGNGELLLDIGFGFHPSKEKNVVGFWGTDALRLGFDFGGYNKGTQHSACTIPSIGGIQAEMSKARRQIIHIAWRQAYNLSYEAIRGKLTRERIAFFSAESAYHQKDDYYKNVEGVTNAFIRGMTRSYGVRDEYRCRATARKQIPMLVQKVGSSSSMRCR